MKQLARCLRKSMTDAERTLWQHLRNRRLAGHKFRRQKPIGPFIADFVCASKNLIVEVDGGQHAGNAEADQQRTTYLAQKGYRVLRFWNHEVLKEKEAVLMHILDALNTPHPDPLPDVERECPSAISSTSIEVNVSRSMDAKTRLAK